MTKEEFEQGYAARSNMTVARLKEHGREARPCDCDYETCQGWYMAFVKLDAEFAALCGEN